MSQGSQIKIIDVVNVGSTLDVERLLKQGFDPNEPDEYGNYAIIVAASRNDIATFKVLMNGGAKLHVINNDGYSAMTFAKANSNEEMIKLIEKTPNPYQRKRN